MRVAAVVAVQLVLFSTIALSFWYQDLRYSLPTPKPKGWVAPLSGQLVRLPSALASIDGRPVLLNFFSTECPCSRFNLDHVRSLRKLYGSKVRFVMVIEGGTSADEEKGFRDLGLDSEHYCDSAGRLAKEVGVYSTPQGVVLDAQHRVAYRGNYNIGRYCNDPRTEFVRLAADAVVKGRPVSAMVAKSGPAYGCAILAVSTWGGTGR